MSAEHVNQPAAIIRDLGRGLFPHELAEAILGHPGSLWQPPAALAQPEGEWPDHVNLIAFAYGREPWATWLRAGGCLESAHCELSDLLTAALARWGRPTAPPAPEHAGGSINDEQRETVEMAAYLQDHGTWLIQSGYANASIKTRDLGIKIYRHGAALLQQLSAPAPAVVPVAVSERLPDPRLESEGGDCDEEGRCWWFSPLSHKIRPCWTLDSEAIVGDTHWLPASAIPLPQVGEVEA